MHLRWQVLSILSAIVLVGTVGCGPSGYMSHAQIRVGPSATTADFARQFDFEWDRVYMFSGYTPRDEISESLGFEWTGPLDWGDEVSESLALVIFVNDGKVVRWFEQDWSISLLALQNQSGYSKSQAKFAVGRAGDSIWLEPLPAQANKRVKPTP